MTRSRAHTASPPRAERERRGQHRKRKRSSRHRPDPHPLTILPTSFLRALLPATLCLTIVGLAAAHKLLREDHGLLSGSSAMRLPVRIGEYSLPARTPPSPANTLSSNRLEDERLEWAVSKLQAEAATPRRNARGAPSHLHASLNSPPSHRHTPHPFPPSPYSHHHSDHPWEQTPVPPPPEEAPPPPPPSLSRASLRRRSSRAASPSSRTQWEGLTLHAPTLGKGAEEMVANSRPGAVDLRGLAGLQQGARRDGRKGGDTIEASARREGRGAGFVKESISDEDALAQAEQALFPSRDAPSARAEEGGLVEVGEELSSHVDAMLDEAVQLLPEEMPFEQVDRMEYMNKHATHRGLPLKERSVASLPPSPPTRRGALPLPPVPPSVHSEFNLTLVTQTDLNRLEYLRECSRRWLHPLSAAILLPPGVALSSALRSRSFGAHVSLHGIQSSGPNASYPINKLRNVALRSVRTTHYVVLDVDLWPSAQLHHAVLAQPRKVLRRTHLALVLPAFQLDIDTLVTTELGRESAQLPSTKRELRGCVESGRCSTFYSRSSPSTHSSTPYDAWWSAPLGSELLPIECFKNPRYEPYVVLPNQPTTPTYSEKFTGYGKNKIEFVTHLRFAGFQFFAVPGAFVTHMPHPKSPDKLSWENGPHRQHMNREYKQFVRELISRYKRPRTPSCSPAQLL